MWFGLICSGFVISCLGCLNCSFVIDYLLVDGSFVFRFITLDLRFD